MGQFSVAAPLLATLIKQLQPKALLKKSAKVLIHPMAMVEGGLSEVEQRIFKELALSSGAHKVVVHVGKELSDEEARALLKSS
ncbi:hypothetical protein [Agarivorans gilvus]|uniref:Uncharacterized protein n=1 Tax=Agarivorans gilvus TaxID=680279 RepID=A0ABQ1I6R4_9ALTE|nr:hypothetical protein [Agarivorans gilvus]GGB22114.1 hypothetical protein GCM10007414_39380 [Agarivorans gilvus]